MNGFGDKVSFIWSVADLLRGPYKPAQYGRVILPLTVLRRLDCVLEPTKAAVLAKHASLQGGQLANIEPVLNHTAKQAFHNTSKLDFPKLTDDPANIAPNLQHYIASFSSRAREIIEYFGFEAEIEKLDKADRLYLVVKKFAEIDLHPDVGEQRRDGLRLRGAGAEVQRGGQRDRRRPLHAARGHPPHGQPALRARRRGAHQARHRAHPLRPRLRHRRHAQRGRGLPARAQPAGAPRVLRPGVQPGVVRDLRQRPDDEGPEPREHQVRRQLHRRRPRRPALRLPARQPALRRGVEAAGDASSATRPSATATTAASAPACRASTTAPSSSCST